MCSQIVADCCGSRRRGKTAIATYLALQIRRNKGNREPKIQK